LDECIIAITPLPGRERAADGTADNRVGVGADVVDEKRPVEIKPLRRSELRALRHPIPRGASWN